jgi:hypothetical protein
MLTDIKTLLGLKDNSQDGFIQLLINLATDDAMNKTGCKNKQDLRSVIIEMTIYKFNRAGTEGLSAETYSGISYTYTSDYPDYILSALDTIKKSQKGKGGFKILW